MRYEMIQCRLRCRIAPMPVFEYGDHWPQLGRRQNDGGERLFHGAAQRLAGEMRRQRVLARDREQMEVERQMALEGRVDFFDRADRSLQGFLVAVAFVDVETAPQSDKKRIVRRLGAVGLATPLRN